MRIVKGWCLAGLLALALTGCSLAQGTTVGPEAIEARAGTTETKMTITGQDGVSFDGLLRLPPGEAVDKLVLYVNGSGPNTYDNHRSTGELEFDYFDLFAKELTERGMAFFSYNTRGVTPGEEPPYYADIDPAEYATYLPTNEVGDVEQMIRALKALPALQGSKVYLLGWSAGTAIAPLVAKAGKVPVDALLLCGYMNGTMEEALVWQQTGGSSMVFYRNYFDADSSGDISPEEFEEDRLNIRPYLDGITFDMLDADKNGVLDARDFEILLADNRASVLAAFEGGDDAWIQENYGIPLTSAWYLDYKNLPPNRETLPTLDLPIFIFHGELDANTSVQGVYDIEEAFQKAGKTNLTAQVFPGADHDLNYLQYLYTGQVPDGFRALLDACAALP